jgi:hypothetical protein
MTKIVNGLLGPERRCEPGETDYPADCERHAEHLHTPGHVARWFRDCACRMCANRRAEQATQQREVRR